MKSLGAATLISFVFPICFGGFGCNSSRSPSNQLRMDARHEIGKDAAPSEFLDTDAQLKFIDVPIGIRDSSWDRAGSEPTIRDLSSDFPNGSDITADSPDVPVPQVYLDANDAQSDVGELFPSVNCKPIVTPMKESLKVTPKILWSAQIPSGAAMGGPAYSKGHLAAVVGTQIHIFNAKGDVAYWMNTDTFTSLSDPIADVEGNFYFTTDIAVSLDSSGKVRWTYPLRVGDIHEGNGSRPRPFLLSPDGILYSYQADGVLTALEKDTGKLLLEKQLVAKITNGPNTLLSASGDVLIVQLDSYNIATVHRKTGEVIAKYQSWDSKLGAVPRLFVKGIGIYTSNWDADTNVSLGFLGKNNQPIWLSQYNYDSDQMGLDLRLVDYRGLAMFWNSAAARDNPARPDRLRFYRCNGEIETEVDLPKPVLRTFTGTFSLGADGTLYALSGPSLMDPTRSSELFALGLDGKVKWSLVFDGHYPGTTETARLPITEDGILYMAFEQVRDGTSIAKSRVVAVQTTSPGLLPSAYPIHRVDNQSTGWSPE